MSDKRRTPKSRHGCSQCKRRSVKCDEKRPQCSNCEKRQVHCHYATPGPWLWAQPGSCHDSTTATPEATMSQEQGVPSQRGNQIATQYTSHRAPSSASEFNTQHLILLLNWSTSTCHSIARNDADSPVWQSVVPRRALSCPLLLHGLFAVSALHLALSSHCHGNEQQALVEDAQCHQSEAIKMFTEITDSWGPSEHRASFALSSLLIGSAFAFPLAVARQPQTKASPLDELIEVFMLIRRMMNFSTPTIDAIQNSDLAGLLFVEDVQLSPSESSQLAIEALHKLLNATCLPGLGNCQVLADAINCLEELLGQLDSAVEMVSRSFIWVCEVPAAFLDLLQEYNPLALVILAHYCVVLHQLRKRWWISSWGKRVLDVIVKTLGPAWQSAVD
ncbi:hypothetical protein BO78DRAFT_267512, partial [Aspergillus sclerotiicarbonarius CBS 121057]